MIFFSGELSDSFSSLTCTVHVLSNSAIFSTITIREDEFSVLTSLFIFFNQNNVYLARVVASGKLFMSQKSERISEEYYAASTMNFAEFVKQFESSGYLLRESYFM